METTLRAPEVMCAVLEKIDKGSVEGRVQRVEVELYAFIGAVWIEGFRKRSNGT